MRLYKKFILTSLALIFITMSLMGVVFLHYAKGYIKKELLINLNAIANLKVDKLHNYFEERKNDLLLIQNSYLLHKKLSACYNL